jgi:RNA polymerase sigma factor (sigma-70 family)
VADITNRELDQLLQQVAQFDHAALQSIYYQIRRSIFAVAYTITRDFYLSEDVVQETIINIWEHAASYRPGSNSKAWIHAIARNQSLDMIKRNKNALSLDSMKDQGLTDHMMNIEVPDGQIDLLTGMNYLTREESIVFILKAVAGLSHLETSKLLNIPYRTVRYQYQRAIKKLRIKLALSYGMKIPKENGG